MFEVELLQYESNVVNSQTENTQSYAYRYRDANVAGSCGVFDEMIKKAQEEYYVTEYNYPSGLIAQENTVGNSKVLSRKDYYYKGKKLKRLYYYENGVLVKTETYNGKGEVVEVKTN